MALYKGTQPLAHNIEVKQVAPPVKNVDIDDTAASLESTYSSEKIEELVAGVEANAAEGYHFYNTPASLGLGATFATKDLVNKMRDLSRTTYSADDVVVYIGNINKTKMTDAPSNYGLLQVFHSGDDFTSIRFSATGNGDSFDTYIGKADAPAYNQAITAITWEKITTDKIIDITTLADLGLTSPTTDIAVCQAVRTLMSNNGGKPVNAVLNVSNVDVITGCPASYGLLKVEVRNGDRHRITFDAVSGAKSIGSYIGNITTTDSSGLWTAITWQKIEDTKGMGTIDGNEADTITIGSDADLTALGFSKDVMTWANGVYRCSHVSDLTNLPAAITVAAPAFRIEHYNLKKWNDNHNPYFSTYGLRYSVLYSADARTIFTRFTESGATAGTITRDTGWIENANGRRNVAGNWNRYHIKLKKRHAGWYGGIVVRSSVMADPIYLNITSTTVDYKTLRGDIVNDITYTIDGVNVEIGITLATTNYGQHTLEFDDMFEVVAFDNAEFTGANTANRAGVAIIHDAITGGNTIHIPSTKATEARYAQKADVYTKTEIDNKFAMTNGSSSGQWGSLAWRKIGNICIVNITIYGTQTSSFGTPIDNAPEPLEQTFGALANTGGKVAYGRIYKNTVSNSVNIQIQLETPTSSLSSPYMGQIVYFTA